MTTPLADLYDEATLARLEATGDPHTFDPHAVRGMRGRIAAGALVTGLVLGFDAVFAAERPKEVIEEVDPSDLAWPDQPVVYLHVPGAPRSSVAFVRR